MSIFKTKAEAGTGGIDPPSHPTSKRIREGTAQQEALWAALTDGNSHVGAEARAGCGKSSSCREGMWRVLERRPEACQVYTVFNKTNATEFSADCPDRVQVGTCHSLAYQALRRAYKCVTEPRKTWMILDEFKETKTLKGYWRKAIADLASHAKNQMLRPDQPFLTDRLEGLVRYFDVETYGKVDMVVGHAIDVLRRSAEWVQVVDFDDMPWLAAVHQVAFPSCDLLYLDEVQDWNRTQHALIPLMAKAGRVVAIGDRYQSIYGFRGADPESIPRLESDFEASPLGLSRMPLTLTFRCPRSHVELARQLVPDIEAHSSNPEGVLEFGVAIDQASGRFRAGDMVLCPTNAPLIKQALGMIASRRPCVVRGRAIGDQLATVLRKCENGCRTIADLSNRIWAWEATELSRLSGTEGTEDQQEEVTDRAAGLLAVVSACTQIPEVEPALRTLFADASPADSVVFSSVHRAKGLEASRVWILEAAGRAPRQPWEIQQQRNLRYVALTRSKNFMAFVRMPDEASGKPAAEKGRY